MKVLQTATGSRYLVDEQEMTIRSEKIGTVKFLGWNVDVLNRACFVINDQQTLQTSPIVNMWECGTIKPRKETLMNKIANILSR